MEKDPLADLVERILAGVDPHRALEEVRHVWGGQRVYLPKDPHGPKERRQRESLAAGATLREACDAAGFSRRTYYRKFRLRIARW